jgi:hypothetical protein
MNIFKKISDFNKKFIFYSIFRNCNLLLYVRFKNILSDKHKELTDEEKLEKEKLEKEKLGDENICINPLNLVKEKENCLFDIKLISDFGQCLINFMLNDTNSSISYNIINSNVFIFEDIDNLQTYEYWSDIIIRYGLLTIQIDNILCLSFQKNINTNKNILTSLMALNYYNKTITPNQFLMSKDNLKIHRLSDLIDDPIINVYLKGLNYNLNNFVNISDDFTLEKTILSILKYNFPNMDDKVVLIEIIYLLYMFNVMLLSVRCNKQIKSLLFNEDKTILYLLDYQFMVPKNVVITDELLSNSISRYNLCEYSFSYYVNERYEGEMSLETYCQYTNTIIFNEFKKMILRYDIKYIVSNNMIHYDNVYIIPTYNRIESDELKIKISTNKSLYGLNYDILLQINNNDNNDYINFMVKKDDLSDIEINKKFYDFIKYVRSYDNRNNKITINKIKLADSTVQTEKINSSYKTFDTLYLRKVDEIRLISLLDNFNTRSELLQSIGIPNKLCILLEGPTGTGKSSTILTIASYLKKNIYYLSFGETIKTNEDLQMIFDHVIKNCNGGIIVAEDIDCVGTLVHKRNYNIDTDYNLVKIIDKNDNNNKLSLSYLLNLLQGTITPDNLIFIATTNCIDNIDPAFYRHGRFDIRLNMKLCDRYQINKIYNKLLNRDVDLSVLNRIAENKYTTAQVIFTIKDYLTDSFTDEEILKHFMV